MQSELADKSLLEHNSQDAYQAGRDAATEELSLENSKLRDMIENLHSEVSKKSKLISEATFKINDLEKQIQRVRDQ